MPRSREESSQFGSEAPLGGPSNVWVGGMLRGGEWRLTRQLRDQNIGKPLRKNTMFVSYIAASFPG